MVGRSRFVYSCVMIAVNLENDLRFNIERATDLSSYTRCLAAHVAGFGPVKRRLHRILCSRIKGRNRPRSSVLTAKDHECRIVKAFE